MIYLNNLRLKSFTRLESWLVHKLKLDGIISKLKSGKMFTFFLAKNKIKTMDQSCHKNPLLSYKKTTELSLHGDNNIHL